MLIRLILSQVCLCVCVCVCVCVCACIEEHEHKLTRAFAGCIFTPLPATPPSLPPSLSPCLPACLPAGCATLTNAVACTNFPFKFDLGRPLPPSLAKRSGGLGCLLPFCGCGPRSLGAQGAQGHLGAQGAGTPACLPACRGLKAYLRALRPI